MSRASQETLDHARTKAEAARVSLQEAQAAFLEGVTRQFEDRILLITKKVAKNQPAVARALGSEGLAELMERARIYIREVAATLRANPDSVEWRVESTFDPFPDSRADQAVFPALYPHLDGLARIFEDSGFDGGRDNREHSQSLIATYELFSTEGLEPLVERVRLAIVAVQQADRNLRTAEKAHTDEDIEDLFEGI